MNINFGTDMINGFEIAKKICETTTYENWDQPRSIDKIDTPRTEFIESFLKFNGINYYTKNYEIDNEYIKNIYVPFIMNSRLETILVTAHHDILNSSSMNFNDNSSSLGVLLNWCRSFDFSKNVFVAFTDNEERGMGGIKKVFEDVDQHLKFYMHIDLDTCGIGNTIIYDEYNHESEEDFIINNINSNYSGSMMLEKKDLPFNQAYYSNSIFDVDSICISRAPKEDGQLNLDIWNKIHTIDDVILSKYKDDFEDFEQSFNNILKNISC